MKIDFFNFKKKNINKLNPIYILTGEEYYQIDTVSKLIIHTAKKNNFEIIKENIDRNFDPSYFSQIINNISLFVSNRLFIFRFKNLPDLKLQKSLIQISQNLSSTDVMLFILPKITKAQENSKWFKSLESVGIHIPIWPMNLNQMMVLFKEYCFKKKIIISNEALVFIANSTEGNIQAGMGIIEKLSMQNAETYDIDDIKSYIFPDQKFTIYDFEDMWILGNKNKAVEILFIIKNSIDIIVILWCIAKTIRILLNLYLANNDTQKMNTIFNENRIWKNKQNSYIYCLKRTNLNILKKSLIYCSEMDKTIKGTSNLDVIQTIIKIIIAI